MADLFEKITDSIDKGIKTVSSKGKEFFESTRLKGEIKNVQKAIEDRFQSLGKKVFEMVNREALNNNELKADCKEIASLFRRVIDLENEIKQVELEAVRMRYGSDIIVCPQCERHNKFDAKFCISCGSSIVVEAPAENNICQTCNAPLKEGAKFCMRCGGKIG
jgi:ribosomal protein L40E/polyhydroxyalkanoate synthesis regulator phasin